MAIVSKADRMEEVIDLTQPDGNAFVLMRHARRLARQLDWPNQKIEAMIGEMLSSDYEHLISIFDDNFGKFVTLVR